MHGAWVNIKATDNSGEFRAYCATPDSGTGPGLVIIQEAYGINQHIQDMARYFASEGYVVLAPDLFWRQEPNLELAYTYDGMQKALELYHEFNLDKGIEDIQATINSMRHLKAFVGDKVGAVGFCLGGTLAYLAACRTDVDVAISYYGSDIVKYLPEVHKITCPLMIHMPKLDTSCNEDAQVAILGALSAHETTEIYVYPDAVHAFARTGSGSYHKPSAMLAHQRSIAVLRPVLGPYYNVEAVWDKHCEYEFADHNVAATMTTMVKEPYVYNIPTNKGGIGHDMVSQFYEKQFSKKV